MIGGIPETQEMLDFCGKHNIVSDVEMINIQQINEAYDRLLKGDVKYRFVIDMSVIEEINRNEVYERNSCHIAIFTSNTDGCRL